jgi:ABC-type branched-subunit amino acid transport system permease subunit
LLIPQMVGTKLPLWTSALSYVVIFGSLALLVWTSGQLSLCHAAFIAFGATAFGHLTDGFGLPWGVALVLAGLLTVPIGALVAIPAIRLSGIYLALATLGFGILMQNVVYPTFLMFGSNLNVTAPRPNLGFIDGSDKWLYYITLFVAALTCLALNRIYRTRPGRLLRALSESPTMLATHGLEVNMIRLAVFCVSSFFAGVGGALALAQTGAASGATYGPITSLLLLAVLAVSGTRLLRSSVLAAVLFALVPGYVTGFGVDRQMFAFGVTAIAATLLVAKRPELVAWIRRAASTSAQRVQRDPLRSIEPRNTHRVESAPDDGPLLDLASPGAQV